VTNGALSGLLRDKPTLWSYTLSYAGVALRMGQLESAARLADDCVLADLATLALNGPGKLGPALFNTSLYAANMLQDTYWPLVCDAGLLPMLVRSRFDLDFLHTRATGLITTGGRLEGHRTSGVA